jgi:DNA repair exonuclease SbcCD ATPase subunit
MSKCVDKETNELIVDIIGADFDSFVHSNVFSFNNIEPFLSRSDKDKKELILPTFFIDKFRAAYKNTTTQIKVVELELQGLNDNEIAITVGRTEKDSQLESVNAEIVEYNRQVEVIKGRISAEQEKQKGLQAQVADRQKAVRNTQMKLKGLSEQTIVNEKRIESYQEKQLAYNKLLNKKLQLEKLLSESQLKMAELKNDSSDLSVHKLTELNKEVEINTKEYNRLDALQKEIGAGILQEDTLLSSILETKKKFEDKLALQTESLRSIAQNIIHANTTIKQLTEQKDKVLGKYFSKECEACPHNKIDEVLQDIEKDIEVQTKSLKETQGTLELVQGHIKKNESKKAELSQLQNESVTKIEKMQTGALQPVKNQLLIVGNKLHDLKNAVIEVQNNVDNGKAIIEEISGIQLRITDTKKQIQLNQKDIEAFGDPALVKKELDEAIAFRKTLRDDTITYQVSEKEAIRIFSELDHDIKDIDRVITELSPQMMPPTNLLSKQSGIIGALDELRKKKENVDVQKKTKGEKLEVLKFWKTGFSSAGVEGFMLDSILNSMNSLVAKYLGYLSNNTIGLTLIPDKTLKSGETRNKISEHVDNESGGPTYKSNSSGERRIMDIAVLFALKYIYEQITKTKYNLVFMDEVFDSLDASTCSLVITLLHSMEDINSIFVVSHSESIALEFDSFVTATKTKGITELS